MATADAVSEPKRRQLILACGALAREILEILRVNGLSHVTLRCLPAALHNTPHKLPDAVRTAIADARSRFDDILVGYGDCGTGGELDRLLADEGIARLEGPHCYAFYSGVADFLGRGDGDMKSFFLTDFLVRQFDTLVIEGLGLDRHPELRDDYFENYERLVYLSQTRDACLLDQARRAADRLGLVFEHRPVGFGDLETEIVGFARAAEQGATKGAPP
jgi:Protein of unknown function (DUF1638)